METSFIRPADDSREVLFLPVNFFGIHTLISQSADRRSVKSISVISPTLILRGSKSAKFGLDFRPQSHLKCSDYEREQQIANLKKRKHLRWIYILPIFGIVRSTQLQELGDIIYLLKMGWENWLNHQQLSHGLSDLLKFRKWGVLWDRKGCGPVKKTFSFKFKMADGAQIRDIEIAK